MNVILVICALVAAVSARPDVSLGYKYPLPGSSVSGSVQYEHGLLAPSVVDSYAPTFGLSSSSSHVHVPSTSYVPSYTSHGYQQQYHQVPIVTKHFYIHSAPEEQADQVTRHITIGRPQKNYRVVFIKAPSQSGAAARISASYAPNEEKTVIYVLSKKPEDIQIEDIATPAPTEPSKPEVFFIKYKTPEEAHHAQQQIQAQYDALGGISKVSNEGQAPVTSVVGVLGAGSTHIHHDIASSSVVSVPSGPSSYLPPTSK